MSNLIIEIAKREAEECLRKAERFSHVAIELTTAAEMSREAPGGHYSAMASHYGDMARAFEKASGFWGAVKESGADPQLLAQIEIVAPPVIGVTNYAINHIGTGLHPSAGSAPPWTLGAEVGES